jgi:NAD(P)-dependent dehydrogenase (short-subunit alcohol dehydrogenase family)
MPMDALATPRMRMNGKAAIVTGGASGIAHAFAREGARICIADLSRAAPRP